MDMRYVPDPENTAEAHLQKALDLLNDRTIQIHATCQYCGNGRMLEVVAIVDIYDCMGWVADLRDEGWRVSHDLCVCPSCVEEILNGQVLEESAYRVIAGVGIRE